MKRRGYRISALGSALRSRGVALGRAIPPSDAPVGVPVTGHGTVVSTAPRLRHDATAPPTYKINVFAKCPALLDDSRSVRHGDEIQKVAEESAGDRMVDSGIERPAWAIVA